MDHAIGPFCLTLDADEYFTGDPQKVIAELLHDTGAATYSGTMTTGTSFSTARIAAGIDT